jgi:CYTH domain-containing protein
MQISQFEKVYFLGRMKPLASLSPFILEALADEAMPVKKHKNEKIITEGESIEALYAAVFGTFDIFISGSKVAEVGEGTLIGDHEVLSGERNSNATVKVTSSYAWLLRIPGSKFLDLLDREPTLLMELTRSLSRRRNGMQEKINEWNKLFSRIKRNLGHLESSMNTIQQIASKSEEEKSQTIELRYLVSVDKKILENAKSMPLKQGYVALQGNNEIRIRYDGKKHTIAGKRDYGNQRIEIKLNIPESLFNAFFKFVGERIISKKRYFLAHGENEWRIDIFEPDTHCSGLAIAEVEINKGDEIPEVPGGITVISDITGDKDYRNRNLAEHGPPK